MSEVVRTEFPKIYSLISNTKKVFLKAPSRVQIFKHAAPSVPLPLQPVLTRWGSWIAAAVYYAQHFESVKKVLESLIGEDSASVRKAKELFEDLEVKNGLVFISRHFSHLPGPITSGVPLDEAQSTFERGFTELKEVPTPVGKKVALYAQSIVSRNRSYMSITDINNVYGNDNTDGPVSIQLPVRALSAFKYAPVTSCDVERYFSRYRNILRDNRRSFLMENLRKTVVVNCNGEFEPEERCEHTS